MSLFRITKKMLLAAAVLWTAISSAYADSDTLVVYFSRAGNQLNGDLKKGNTAVVAEMIAKKLNADIFEVKPVIDNYNIPYRKLTELASQEKDNNIRPKYEGNIQNLDKYSKVFIGSPVWWGDFPMIMYTFFDKNNLNGKVIYPFATHEGSGLSSFDLRLQSFYPAADVRVGLAIRGKETQNNDEEILSKITKWIDNN